MGDTAGTTTLKKIAQEHLNCYFARAASRHPQPRHAHGPRIIKPLVAAFNRSRGGALEAPPRLTHIDPHPPL